MIGKNELAVALAREAELPLTYSKEIVDIFIDLLKLFIHEGHDIRLDKLGTFTVYLYKPNKMRPQIKERYRIKFSPSKPFEEEVNDKFMEIRQKQVDISDKV
jgi:nucleoid DNA-binding protein